MPCAGRRAGAVGSAARGAGPAADDAVRLAGAAYLLFLAIKAFRASGCAAGTDKKTDDMPPARIFQQGLITNLLNPKMVLFVLALFPQFVRPDGGPLIMQMLTSVLNTLGLAVNGAVILAVNRIAGRLSGNDRRRWPGGNHVLGLACRLALPGGHRNEARPDIQAAGRCRHAGQPPHSPNAPTGSNRVH
ncbi:LysE family translocator [Paludibacterium paludis]|uniref:LysE type translocator n=1 Tax=Paludibacterium paludis TaxID=1225769 RepID=A0A918P629_9NEIS|nr:LysE family translocator [Paludibacterium paludis]GGY24211.1 hypothetical protein GCM10011289_29940 [Paludibacterium paludis]